MLNKNQQIIVIVVSIIAGIAIALALILGLYYAHKRKNNNVAVQWLNSTEMYSIFPGGNPMENQMGPLLISPFADTSGVWTVQNGQVVIAPYQNGALNQQWYFYTAGGPWGSAWPAYIGTDLGNIIVTSGNDTSSSTALSVQPVTTSTVGDIANPAIVDTGIRENTTSDCEGYLFFNGNGYQYYLLPITNSSGTSVTYQASLNQPTECDTFSMIYFGTLPTTEFTILQQ